MSGKTSDDEYKLWWEASQKFEYFVTGGSAAVIVWAAEPLKGLGKLTAEVWLIGSAVIVLALATAFGIFRLRDTVHIRALNWERFDLEEQKEEIRAASRGGILAVPDAVERVQRRDTKIGKVKTTMKAAQDRAALYHTVRTALLLIGLSLAIAGRFTHFFIPA